jgi:xylulokinase
VITGTIDAWAEAIGAGAHAQGDLLVMYGTTLFLVHTVGEALTSSSLWGTVGALPGTRSLAGGMATSGAITGWMRQLVGGPAFEDLLREAEESGPGARGLLLLPYFAGERTPLMDPAARGVIAGLTLDHSRGDLYRAALEGVACGARHIIEVMDAAGGNVRRMVAAGGGTRGRLWSQIVSDVTGLDQVIPTQTIGACYGDALLAAQAIGDANVEDWNPPVEVLHPRSRLAADYDELYHLYRQLYQGTKGVLHTLAARQQREHESRLLTPLVTTT